jgi:hypothetical protein
MCGAFALLFAAVLGRLAAGTLNPMPLAGTRKV